MFLRPKESLRLSLHSLRRFKGFLNCRDFHSTQCAYLRQVSGRRKTVEVQDCENSSSVAGEFSASVPPKNVNDNFFGIESDEGVIEIKSKPSLNNTARQQFLNVEQEKFVSTIFGTVRYDSENKPKSHGQLEKEDVLVSSLNHDKIRTLNRKLLKKNSLDSRCVSLNTENSRAVGDISNGNLKSKPISSSYVDELYFPESYAEKEDHTISKLESTSSSSNEDKLNYMEESYFGDKVTDDSIFKNNAGSETINGRDKNHPILQEKPTEHVADDKQSNYFDNYYFNTISESNLESIGDKSSGYVSKFRDIIKEQSNEENLSISPGVEKNELSEKLFLNESEVNIADSKVTRNARFNTENFSNIQKTKPNMTTSSNLNERIEKNNAFDDREPLSLKLNNPNLEELNYNKFMPNATDLPKRKNNFLLQNKAFLKKIESTNSSSSSRFRKLKSLERNVDVTDAAEETQNKEEAVKTTEMQNSKVKKETNAKNSNTNELPETASDFVKQLRSTKTKLEPELINGKFVQKTEKYDSKGFRILKNQVPDLKYYTRDEILDLLVKNVLYSDDDLIVLNKPYNLVMHESKTTKDPCLSQYLDDLAGELDKKTNKPKLITVHRLDKETTGCLLLARSEISAQKLLSYFSQRKVVKTYWIVTTKVPDPLEGVIDMPISEGSVNGSRRMVLHPDLPKDIPYQNHSRSGKRAVTHYKVIAESGSAALVEAKPETGIKHQIRVHFGFGLSCPILGDHKYSHFDKLAPQKLQADLLQRLHVRQSKVRYIPMHIYARSIFIPQYQEGKNLFVMAPMPTHMSKNLQKLKFKKN